MGDWLDEGGQGVPCDVGALLDGKGWDALRDVVAMGALVSLGTTSDGGALGVTITVDGRWRREYFRDGTDLTDWITGGLEDIRAAVTQSRALPASSGSRSRRRGR